MFLKGMLVGGIIGLIIGESVTFIIMALCCSAKQADKNMGVEEGIRNDEYRI